MGLIQSILAALPTTRRAVVSLSMEPLNLSATATATTVQSALRMAEGGDTRELFTLYRDALLGDDHVQGEFSKRKLALLNQPFSVLPFDKDDAADVEAAAQIKTIIGQCENWNDGLIYLLNSALWPVSLVEKIFAPAEPGSGFNFILRRFEPVDMSLLTFRQDAYHRGPRLAELVTQEWQPALRLWETDADGHILWDIDRAYHPERPRHIVHRGHMLVGFRDNYGGPFRSILGWWLLRQLGRDWFGRFMERYGSPFIVGKTDTANKAKVTFFQESLALATKLCGLVISADDQVELKEAAVSGGAAGHEAWGKACNNAISRLICGSDANSKPAGLNSGESQEISEVRDDLRLWDQAKLAETIRQQLFGQLMQINGIPGRAPLVVWGGLSQAEAKALAETLNTLGQAGLEPEDEALPHLQEKIGFAIRRKMAAAAPQLPGAPAAITLHALRADPPSATDKLIDNVMENITGVQAKWLGGVRPFFEDLMSLAVDQNVSDADFREALVQAQRNIPDLFSRLDTAALSAALEESMGAACVNGAVAAELRRRAAMRHRNSAPSRANSQAKP